jgi:hypothetical protein
MAFKDLSALLLLFALACVVARLAWELHTLAKHLLTMLGLLKDQMNLAKLHGDLIEQHTEMLAELIERVKPR